MNHNMVSDAHRAMSTTSYVKIIPFTGPLFAVWAFFSPDGFGRWFGTIIHAFRAAAGF